MHRLITTKTLITLLATAVMLCSSLLFAHHSSQAQFGEFGSNTKTFEGKIAKISWGNPHITMDMDIPAGEKWRF